MKEVINVYCDESCHLENDGKNVMVLGAVWCPLRKTRDIAVRLRELKVKHRLDPAFEIKWTKVGPNKVAFYLDVIDYFFDDDHLHYRGLIVPDKALLNHPKYSQTHDVWYYKMFFQLLKLIIDPEFVYRIYLDIKDTKSEEKVNKLREVLSNNLYDFSQNIIERLQTVRSHEVEQVQVADLLTGALSYLNRGCEGNSGKEKLIERIKGRSGYNLSKSTLPRESKMNIFRWRANESD